MKELIDTVSKFEASGIFAKLGLVSTKSPRGYKLYKDPENACLIALQLGDGEKISAMKVLPLSSGLTEQGHAAIAVVVMEFVFGENSSADENLREGFAKKLQMVSDEEGMHIQGVDEFERSLCKSSTRYPGIVCATKDARPWEIEAGVTG